MKKYIILGLILALFVVLPVAAQSDSSALIARLRAQIAELTAQLNRLLAQQKPDGFCYDFTKDIKFGNTGTDDIKYLQRAMVTESVTPLVGPTRASFDNPDPAFFEYNPGYVPTFSNDTLSSVKKFQAKYGIPNTGYVGPLTRAKLNALYGCNKKVFITPAVLPDTKAGEFYNHTLKVHGLSGVVEWKIVSGSLHPDYSLVKDTRACPTPPPNSSGPAVAVLPCGPNVETYQAHISGSGYKYGTYGVPILVDPGTYTFTVQATNGTQTATQNYSLRVLPKDGNNQAPVISGVSGPTTLKVGETGTWTVRATDPNNGTLRYWVWWGDERSGPLTNIGDSTSPVYAQTSTFTHIYNEPGNYSPRFLVLNDTKYSAETSLTVNVVSQTQPAITVTSPNGGEKWQVGTTQTISWKNSLPNVPLSIYLVTQSASYSCRKAGGTICPADISAYYPIAINIRAEDGRYSWKVTGIEGRISPDGGSRFWVQICQSPTGERGYCDDSDDLITIVNNNAAITVTSPNGGEVWTTYDTQNISWNWPNAKRTDKVDLWLDREFNCPTGSECPLLYPVSYPAPIVLDKNIAARASYNWIVATDIINNLIPAGQYRVRVCQAGAETNCDASDQSFTITVPRF